ncbi:TPA: hypothetical protein ACN310_003590 [Vibrio parahaemolyticus]|nr:hypothetical protein FVP00_21315 [Vibrio parahaemolyticus]
MVAAILSGGLVNFPQGCLKGDEGIYHCVDFTFTGYRSLRLSSSVWLNMDVVNSTIFHHNSVIFIPYFVSKII